MEKITITGSQHERTWDLDFNYIPSNDQEFIDTIANAPWYILKGMGFCIWDKYNHVAEKNAAKPEHSIIEMPAYDMNLNEAGTVKFDVGRGNAPTVKLEVEHDILLIPGEWYNSIPEGFELIDICGHKELFKKGETDNDIRFGCLAYGIIRPSSMQTEQKQNGG